MLYLTFSAPLLAALQVTAPAMPPDLTWVGQVEHIGLVSGMAIALWVLWTSMRAEKSQARADLASKDVLLSERDKKILDMVEHVTATLISQVEASREQRKVIEEVIGMQRESISIKDRLVASLDNLCEAVAAMPCTRDLALTEAIGSSKRK